MFKLFFIEQTTINTIDITNPCYPSYAIRDVYMHDGFDYIILVEDLLTKHIVDYVIKKLKLNKSKLINILPIGGWENVLKFQNEAYLTNTFGLGTKVFSVLDGDIKNQINKQYDSFPKIFLPIDSIEKYLFKILTEPSYHNIKKEINDHFFYVKSLDDILSDYYKDGDKSGKHLYQKIIKNLNSRNISEDTFIKELCSIIVNHTDFSKFEISIQKQLA